MYHDARLGCAVIICISINMQSLVRGISPWDVSWSWLQDRDHSPLRYDTLCITLYAHYIPIVGLVKKRRTLIGPWSPAKAAPVTGTTFEDYWPGADGLSAVNAFGTQLSDPTNLGLARWRTAV